MLSHLVVTTRQNLSRAYFARPDVAVRFYGEPCFEEIAPSEIKTIYLRDPFNTGHFHLPTLAKWVEDMAARFSSAYFIDHARCLDDLLIEDKWRQYELLARFMPRTYVASRGEQVPEGCIAKKRLSSRSRGIRFAGSPGELTDEWIIQPKLRIVEELRVYVQFGRIKETATIKRSKTPNQATKIVGVRQITEGERAFSGAITAALPRLDFIGLDIARIEGGLFLIEANRSPQFARYHQLTGTNLADGFWEAALGRMQLTGFPFSTTFGKCSDEQPGGTCER